MASRLTLGIAQSKEINEIKESQNSRANTAKFSIDEYGKQEIKSQERNQIQQKTSGPEKKKSSNHAWKFPLTPRLVSSNRKKINFTSPSPSRLKLAHSDIHKPVREDLQSSKISRPRKNTANLLKTAPLLGKSPGQRISQKRRIEQKRFIMKNLVRMRSPREKTDGLGLSKMEKYFKTVSVSNLNRARAIKVKKEFSSMKQTPKIDLKEFVGKNWGDQASSNGSKKRSIRKIQIIQKPKGYPSFERGNEKLHNSLHFHDSNKKKAGASRFGASKSGFQVIDSESQDGNKDSAVQPLFEYGRSKSFKTGEQIEEREKKDRDERSDLIDWTNVKSQFDHRSFGRSLSKKTSSVENVFSKSRERNAKFENKNIGKMKSKAAKKNQQQKMVKNRVGKFGVFKGRLEQKIIIGKKSAGGPAFGNDENEFFEYDRISEEEEKSTNVKKQNKNVFFMDPLGADTQGSNNHESKQIPKSNITSLVGKVEEPMFLEGINSFRNIAVIEKRKVTDGISLLRNNSIFLF